MRVGYSRQNKKAFLTISIGLLLLNLSRSAMADVASDFAADTSSAQAINGMLQFQNGGVTINRMINGKPTVMTYQAGDVPQATSNPTQTTYYNNPNAIQQNDGSALQKDTAGQALVNQFNNAPKITIDPNSPGMQRSLLIQSDAADVAQGISDKYVNCQQQNICHTTYRNQQCTQTYQQNLTCEKNLSEQVIPPTPINENVTINLSTSMAGAFWGFYADDHMQASLPLSRIIAPMDYMGQNTVETVSPSLASLAQNCNDLSTSVVSVNSDRITHITIEQLPTCANNGVLYYYWQHYGSRSSVPSTASIVLHVTYTPPPTVQDQWDDSQCQNLSSIPNCGLTKETCTEGPETRNVGHIPVTRSCWQYTDQYQCGTNNNSCGNSIAGCDQINSVCNSVLAGICQSYTSTYQCPVNTCTGSGIACGANFFCIKGDCSPTTPTQNQNFGKDDAQVAAVTDGLDQMIQNTNTLQAFSGTAMSCRELPVGALNCCANSGWGKDSGLMKCNQEEQQLGAAKEKGVAVEVGEYCSHEILGVCLEHSQGYCTFTDLLSYDVQVQGREGQLHRGFGSGQSPDCSGLSVQDMQNINFNAIDFSNDIQQLENQSNFPNSQAVQNAIAQQINNDVGGAK